MRWVLVLLLLVCAGAAGLVLWRGSGSEPVGPPADLGRVARAPREGTASPPSDRPGALPGRAPPEPEPLGPEERIVVLGEGRPPPRPVGEPLEPGRLVRIPAGTPERPATGADVLRAVSQVLKIYLPTERARRGLEGLPLPPEAGAEEGLPLELILAHWRHHGFQALPFGRALLVVERAGEVPPDPVPPPPEEGR